MSTPCPDGTRIRHASETSHPAGYRTCPRCAGWGVRVEPSTDGSGRRLVQCPACAGKRAMPPGDYEDWQRKQAS